MGFKGLQIWMLKCFILHVNEFWLKKDQHKSYPLNMEDNNVRQTIQAGNVYISHSKWKDRQPDNKGKKNTTNNPNPG